jgi:hypothetical protein
MIRQAVGLAAGLPGCGHAFQSEPPVLWQPGGSTRPKVSSTLVRLSRYGDGRRGSWHRVNKLKASRLEVNFTTRTARRGGNLPLAVGDLPLARPQRSALAVGAAQKGAAGLQEAVDPRRCLRKDKPNGSFIRRRREHFGAPLRSIDTLTESQN